MSRIVLSAGGDEKELAAVGLGMAHVEELMVRMARRLLAEGHLLAFGGTLGVPAASLTRLLIDAAQGWLADGAAGKADPRRPETWPLVNYSPWPFHTRIDAEDEARKVGLCAFLKVDPRGGAPSGPVGDIPPKAPPATVTYADALTEMRRRSAEECGLRVVWAGKIRGAAGWLPGIAEEVDASLALDRPVVVLGGFGGCAGEIAGYLRGGPWPAALTLADAMTSDAYAITVHAGSREDEVAARFDDLRHRLGRLRERLQRGEEVGGLPAALLKGALEADSPRVALAAATEAARRVRARGAAPG